jgi:response regulator of citrate/malate metabolism
MTRFTTLGPNTVGVRDAGFDRVAWIWELEDDHTLAHIAKLTRLSTITVKKYLGWKREAEAFFYI